MCRFHKIALRTFMLIGCVFSLIGCVFSMMPYAVSQGRTDGSSISYEDALFAAIALAHEAPDLMNASLPPGYSEIRVRGHLSSECCFPTAMLRLIEGPDDFRGEVLLFRRLVLRQGNPEPLSDERCVPLENQHICVRIWNSRSDDWSGIAAALRELGVWSISERCEVTQNADGTTTGNSLTHNGNLHIQRLIGDGFSAYSCNAPGTRSTAVGRQANTIYEYFNLSVGPILRDEYALTR
jgi:hypothetical protein